MSQFFVSLGYSGETNRDELLKTGISEFTGGIPKILSVPGVPPVTVRATRAHDKSGPDAGKDAYCRLDLEVEIEAGMLNSPGVLIRRTGDHLQVPPEEPDDIWGPLRWAWRETQRVTPMEHSHIYSIFLHADGDETGMLLQYEVLNNHGEPHANAQGDALLLSLYADIQP